MSEYEIGDSVRYIPGYKGWHAATVVGYEGSRLVIEFSSGLEFTCRPDELEAV